MSPPAELSASFSGWERERGEKKRHGSYCSSSGGRFFFPDPQLINGVEMKECLREHLRLLGACLYVPAHEDTGFPPDASHDGSLRLLAR